MYFEFKIKRRQDDKVVTEQYFTDAEFFAEVEHKALAMDGDPEVVAIAHSDVREVVNAQAMGKDYYYKATIVDSFKRDDGTVKELKYKVLVAADDVQEATRTVQEFMKQGLADMRLDAVKCTKIEELIDVKF